MVFGSGCSLEIRQVLGINDVMRIMVVLDGFVATLDGFGHKGFGNHCIGISMVLGVGVGNQDGV